MKKKSTTSIKSYKVLLKEFPLNDRTLLRIPSSDSIKRFNFEFLIQYNFLNGNKFFISQELLPNNESLASFSNDDGEGTGNVTIKINSRFSNVVEIIPPGFKCQM